MFFKLNVIILFKPSSPIKVSSSFLHHGYTYIIIPPVVFSYLTRLSFNALLCKFFVNHSILAVGVELFEVREKGNKPSEDPYLNNNYHKFFVSLYYIKKGSNIHYHDRSFILFVLVFYYFPCDIFSYF